MENKNINTDMLDEEKLLEAIFADDIKVRNAERKASERLAALEKMVTIDEIINSVEVAQMTLAEDFEKWDEMDDDEKNDLAEMMCGLMVARDLLAYMFGRPTSGRVERVEEDE